MKKLLIIAVLVAVVFVGCLHATEKIVFDFESGDLQGWEILELYGKGKAKCSVVCGRGDDVEGRASSNKQGKYFLSSLEGDDNKPSVRFQLEAVSPVFVIDKQEMSFLIGGGASEETYVALCRAGDGIEILKAHGNETETMRKVSWNVPEVVGKEVYLKMVDRKWKSGEYITFDNFTASGSIVKQTREKDALKGLGTLKASVVSLMDSYPAYKEKGRVFLGRIASYEKQLKVGDGNTVLLNEIAGFRHEVITSNPLIRDNSILFVTRRQYKKDHHNTATMFQTGERNTRSYDPVGAYMKTIDFSQGAKVTTIVDPGAEGLIRDPEIHYDGGKIIFSMRKNIEGNYHIFEVNVDGSGLQQLTSAEGVFDIDPVYLPDGNIVFTSSREPKFCMCNRHIMGNMFKMEADGANIHQIGRSTLFEGHSAMLADGRIIYDRWEYVDRNFGDAQGLWVVNPDGTNHAIYWGNNTTSPGAVLDAREIPATSLVICIFSSCHDRPWGAIAIIDRQKGVEGRGPVIRTWPAYAINKISTVGINKSDFYKNIKIKYEDPFPLDKNYFLVSRMTGEDEKTGIYLIDTFGNEDLLHAEGEGCFDPKPIKKYRRPRIIPARRDFENKAGKFYVQNAYIGTHMKGVKPGSIKYLRVVESPEKRSWTGPSWGGQGAIAPSMNWHDFNNKRILGTVSVEEDGSAFFEAPSDTFLYFQLLDEDGKMIHSMRSGTIIQSGETQGCVGCHEDRVKDTPAAMNVTALREAPGKLSGWNGKPRLFNYLAEVQPVFDKHCVRCHDFGKKAGEKLNLAGDKTVFFNTSYMELWRKKLISCIGAGQSQIQEAYSWGSHKSKLIEVLDKGHNNVKLSKEDYDRLVTWIDINGPYYPTYDSAYPSGTSGRGPLTHAQLKKLSELTGAKFNANYGSNAGPLVSFDRPELSLCLQKLEQNSSAYKEALAIIKSGQRTLAEKPRADMPGFKAAEYALKRQEFYCEREKKELKNKKAIRENRKMYDK